MSTILMSPGFATPPNRLGATPDTAAPAAAAIDAVKVYGRGEAQVRALDGVTVGFATGRFTAIMGPSGSGKSTLITASPARHPHRGRSVGENRPEH